MLLRYLNPNPDCLSVRRERFWRPCAHTSHSFPSPYLSQLTGPFPGSGLLCWVHQNGKCGLPTNCKRCPCSRGARFLSPGAHTAMRRSSPRLSKIPLGPSLSPSESTFPSPSLGLGHLTRGHFLIFQSSMRSAHGRQKSKQDEESPLPRLVSSPHSRILLTREAHEPPGRHPSDAFRVHSSSKTVWERREALKVAGNELAKNASPKVCRSHWAPECPEAVGLDYSIPRKEKAVTLRIFPTHITSRETLITQTTTPLSFLIAVFRIMWIISCFSSIAFVCLCRHSPNSFMSCFADFPLVEDDVR